MIKKCLHGYKTRDEIETHFCESDESIKMCGKCKFLDYDSNTGIMVCKNGEDDV